MPQNLASPFLLKYFPQLIAQVLASAFEALVSCCEVSASLLLFESFPRSSM